MSRARGPRRVDRAKDREEIVALATDVWRRTIELSMRVPFAATHYAALSEVTVALYRLLDALGEAPCKPHSINCAIGPADRDG